MKNEWKHIVVLGAAGKMGSGISLLLVQEIAKMKDSILTLLDTRAASFEGLRKYLRLNLLKYAERNINKLRGYYVERKDLVDNAEIIQTFVEDTLDRVRLVTSLEECRGATMVFEAILEDVEVKAKVFNKLKNIVADTAFYFSNTSSIPIHVLQEKSHLNGRLIGLHFYNPPIVQKLLEVIVPQKIDQDVKDLALSVGKQLNKIIVFSEDKAGFIGNGHFIREVVEACKHVEELQKRIPLTEAICLVNFVTQDLLLRPMGIFQLVDYVGIDVVQHIAKVMTQYLPGHVFHPILVDAMISAGIKGGQHGDSTQKNGIFTYEKGKPVGVYHLEDKGYIPYIIDNEGNKLSRGEESWKTLSKDKELKSRLFEYFARLFSDQSKTAKLAVEFLETSRGIAYGLVAEGVARSVEDVDTVLKNGFFHLYGVDDPWKSRGES